MNDFGRRVFKVLALVILTYVTCDLIDPSLPGIFFFGSDQLFVDGTLQTKDASGSDDSARPMPDRMFSIAFDARPRTVTPSIAPARVARHWRAQQKRPAATNVLSPPSDDTASA